MREIHVSALTEKIAELCKKACTELPEDVVENLSKALGKEKSEVGRETLRDIKTNLQIAKDESVPLCQDTGFTVVVLDIGQDVHLTGGDLEDAVNEGVRRGYKEGYLRTSILRDPIKRDKNTGDNTPAVVHTHLVPGDKIEISVLPKGGGSENKSALKMLTPADGLAGVKKFVIDTVSKAGPSACPPLTVGVGIGGTFDKVAWLAKKAIFRKSGTHNPDPFYAKIEEELLEEINKLGIGPMGLGGSTTSIAVHVETFPCHIASLPVAVNIQCHSARHKEAVI
ncbi:MAG TPA: fumarate hydratase [bacterium]|nr:fumarate hydratase [bacterium]